MGKLIAKPSLREQVETSDRLMGIAHKYRFRYAELGRERISRFWEGGQRPRKIVISPALGLREFGANPVSGDLPGDAFTVTCREGMTLDSVGEAALFHALHNLGVRRLECHGRGADRTEARDSTLRAMDSFPVWGQIKKIARECGLGLGFKQGKKTVGVHSYYYYFHDDYFGEKWAVINEDNAHSIRKPAGGIVDSVPDALIIECSDARVMGKQIFEGIDIALVSNWGNVLSEVALDAIEALVKEGLPAVVILGHNRCDAIYAAIEGSTEERFEPLMRMLEANLAGSEMNSRSLAAVRNINSCVDMLSGDKKAKGAGSHRIRRVARMMEGRGTIAFSLYADLSSGIIMSFPVEPNWWKD
ncbi:hypothetical protein JW721_03110 [Candidatus Micrarchaeota archaeon]|nr:hypothetical protein [Candidatus Micrarchaeota archaeon]